MTQEQREQAARTLQEFYDFNKTLTPQGESWLQADITINRYTQEELGKALPTAIAALREQGWVRTSVRVPTVLDIDDEGKVPVLIRGMLTRSLIRISLFYKSVTTDTAEYFLPLPKLPEVEE